MVYGFVFTCMILVTYGATTCMPANRSWFSMALFKSLASLGVNSTPGKRSERSALKRGRSAKMSLGLIKSRIARWSITSSGKSGSTRFMAPAARAIGMTKDRSP